MGMLPAGKALAGPFQVRSKHYRSATVALYINNTFDGNGAGNADNNVYVSLRVVRRAPAQCNPSHWRRLRFNKVAPTFTV